LHTAKAVHHAGHGRDEDIVRQSVGADVHD
jgi:hypothetical protein